MVVVWDEFTLTFRPYWILQLFVGGVHLDLLLRERTPQLQAQCTLVATHTVEKSQPCDARWTTSCAPTLLFTISYELLVLALQLPVFTRLPLKGLALVLPNPSSWKTSDELRILSQQLRDEEAAQLSAARRADGAEALLSKVCAELDGHRQSEPSLTVPDADPLHTDLDLEHLRQQLAEVGLTMALGRLCLHVPRCVRTF